MNIRRFLHRILIPLLLMAALACTVTGHLLPSAPEVTTPANSPIMGLTPTGMPSHTPSVSRRPSFTQTPACIDPAGSINKSEIREEVESLVPGADVLWYDDFLCDRLEDGWGTGGMNPKMQIAVSNGIVSIHTEKYDDIWEGLGRTQSSLHDDMGFLALFRFKEKTIGNLALVTGTWQTPSNHSWMLELRYENAQTAGWGGWEGDRWTGGNLPPSVLRPDKWYYLLLRMGDTGKFTGKVWEKDKPDNHADFYRTVNSGWAGLHWNALFQVYEGTMDLDRYFELSFAGNE
jgi:hypothetical protein